jgi:ferrochelatase
MNKAVLLINMGSPSSQKEMKYFLQKMFRDPAIIPFPAFLRNLIAFIISNVRYKESWEKYELIGGSPLMESMNNINKLLSDELGKEYIVTVAYSYSQPGIKDGIDYLSSKGVKEIKVIPMYPHSSFSTTGSVKRDISEIKNSLRSSHLPVITVAESFYNNKHFIKFWKSAIESAITKYKLITQNSELITQNPEHKTILLFSAHAIPQSHVRNGDKYVEEIKESARLIASTLNLDYKVSFQSKIGKIKWVEPDTKELLKEFSVLSSQFSVPSSQISVPSSQISALSSQLSALSSQLSVLIVPISFLNENLETLYDLEHDIIPYAKSELGIQNIFRVEIPSSHPSLIKTFSDIILRLGSA